MQNLKTWLFAAACALLLVACAEQRIRDDSNQELRAGHFESALEQLQQGVRDYPDSATLRAGLTSARAEASSRLISEAQRLRAQNQVAQAQAAVQRGLQLDPGNARLQALSSELEGSKRQQAEFDEIKALIAAGKRSSALALVDDALRTYPRNSELLGLQRRLRLDLQQIEVGGRGLNLAEGRPMSMDFRNAPLSTVLEAITRNSGIDFVLDKDVRQDSRVTVLLRNTKVADALDLVINANQLARRVLDAKTVLIYPNTPEKQREHQEQVIRVFHLSNVDAKSTAALLRTMLRIKEPFVDERANLISIRESPDVVALAERLVALHDLADAEVMMDVEILEIKTSRLTELGINFPNSIGLTALPSGGSTGLTVAGLRSLGDNQIGVSIGSLLLNMRREVGDVNILANPRIRAKNKEKAHILIGDKVPVITSTTNATGFVAETVNYLDVGLKLDVEPLVSPDDEVTIKMGLEVSTLAKEVRTNAGSLAYQIGTRNANTTLKLRDGETQLLAGLISKEDRSSANRVPGLGDLPLAGRLFSSQKDDVQRTELVLAITPRILRPAPNPELIQSELWVGTEQSTRLRTHPALRIGDGDSNGPRPSAQGKAGAAPANQVEGSARPDEMAKRSSQRVQATWKGPQEVLAGEVFTLRLQLDSGSPLRGAPAEFSFPTSAVEILDVTEGGYFKQDEGVTSFTHSINPQTGRVGVGILRNDSSGASGQGIVLMVRARAKSAGPVQIQLTSLKPIGLSGPVALGELPQWKIDVK